MWVEGYAVWVAIVSVVCVVVMLALWLGATIGEILDDWIGDRDQ